MRATRISEQTMANSIRLPVLDDDAFEDVGDILAPVGRLLEEVQYLLPLDDGDWIFFLFEQPAQRLVVQPVGLVLEAVHFNRELVHVRLSLQGGNRHAHLIARPDDDARQLSGAVADRRYPVAANHR